MIHEFTLVLDREPAETGLRALAVAGLDPIGTEGPHQSWRSLPPAPPPRSPKSPRAYPPFGAAAGSR